MKLRNKIVLGGLCIGVASVFLLDFPISNVGLEDNQSVVNNSSQAAKLQPGFLPRLSSRETLNANPELDSQEQPTTASEDSKQGMVTGIISDETGHPLQGWHVYLIDSLFQTEAFASTNKLGEYQLVSIKPGRYKMTLSHLKKRINRSLEEELDVLSNDALVRNFRVKLGSGVLKGRFGMSEELGNGVVLELLLYSSSDLSRPIARSSAAIDWQKESLDGTVDYESGKERVIHSTEGQFVFKSLPADLYTLKVVFDAKNGFVIEEPVQLHEGQEVDLGFSVYRLEDFLQAKLGYIPEWADAFKEALIEAGK